MDFATNHHDGSVSLRLRRVRYPGRSRESRAGVVIEHELSRGMVTVLDTDDGTFWRGRADSIVVLV